MNVLYVTGKPSDADSMRSVLAGVAPSLHVDVVARVADAQEKLQAQDHYEAVLFDLAVAGADLPGWVQGFRRLNATAPLIVVLGPGEPDPPVEALRSGADEYVAGRPGFAGQLPAVLQRILDRRQAAAERRRSTVHILYAGGAERGLEELGREPWLHIHAVHFEPDASLELPESRSGPVPYDALVLDDSLRGAQILQCLRDALNRLPDLPVLLLVAPEREETAIQGLKLGAAGYVVKSGRYAQRLARDLESCASRHQLTREKGALICTEARLRRIIETVPAGVVLLAADGAFLALNWAGLVLIGATRVEEVVGRNFLELVGPDEAKRLRLFLDHICKGERDAIEFQWGGLDGAAREFELRAVPIRRELEGTTTVLGVLSDLTEQNSIRKALGDAEIHRSELQRTLEESSARRFDAEREKLEQEVRNLERSRDTALASLQIADDRLSTLEEEYRKERTHWESVLEELEGSLLAREQSGRAEEEKHSAREAAWASERGSLEKRCASLEEKCASLEREKDSLDAGRSDAAARLQTEQGRWDAERQAAEQEQRILSERCASLEKERQEAEASRADLAARLEAERQAAEQERRILSERCASLEKERQGAEASRAELAARLHAELGRGEAELRALDQQRRSLEEKCASLEAARQAAEGGRAELAGRAQAEQGRWEAELRALDQQRRSLEEKCASLEAARQAAEGGRTELAARLQAEQKRAGALDERRLGTEKLARELEKARSDAENRLAGLSRRLQADRARWDAEREALESQCRIAEEKCAGLEAARSALQARDAELSAQVRLERSRAEAEREALERRRRVTEEKLIGIESALSELQAREAALAESQAADAARAEDNARKLEQQRDALQGALVRAEAAKAKLFVESEQERLRQEQGRVAVEQRLRELEQEVRSGESRRAELVSAHQAERQQTQAARQALQDRIAALEEELREAMRRQKSLVDEHRSERASLEASRQELEQQYAEAERLRASLRETASRYQSVVRQQSDNFHELLCDTLTHSQRDAEERIRMLAQEQAEERDSLQNEVKNAHARLQQVERLLEQERGRLEARLHIVHQELQRLCDSGFIGLCTTTCDGTLLKCNDGFARILGYESADEAMSRAGEAPLRALAERKVLNSRLQKEGCLKNVESCLNRADGHLAWVLEDAVLVPGEPGNPPVAERIFIDVTERHRLYDEIRRARRRENVNRLTSATVQDFTDLLTSMMGYGELLLDGLDAHDPRRRQAERIREVACKAGELARQFAASSLREDARQETLDLNTVIQGAEMLIRQLIGEDIEFLVRLTPGPALVPAQRQEIEQLLTTLLVNVRDALPVGGTVSVETTLAVHGPDPQRGPSVVVAVRGSGYGSQPVQTTSSLDSIVAGLGGVLRSGADPRTGPFYELYLPAGEQDTACPGGPSGDLMPTPARG